MKILLLFKTFLVFFLLTIRVSGAADIYAEYTMSGFGGKTYISKMFGKNGDLRTEAEMDFGGRKMKTVTLMLRSKPDVAIVYNSMSTTYTETKRTSSGTSDFSVTVIGNEKVGQYNCTHVRMSSSGSNWDMWYTKDLAGLNFPVDGDPAASRQMMEKLNSKGISGMLVKLVFFKQGTTTPGMTMLMTRYEAKPLDAALFAIPAGYTKSSLGTIDPEKMKTMTPEERKEMLMKMMQEQGLK